MFSEKFHQLSQSPMPEALLLPWELELEKYKKLELEKYKNLELEKYKKFGIRKSWNERNRKFGI